MTRDSMMRILAKLFNNGKDKRAQSKDLVQFDDAIITRIMRNGSQESVRWDDLYEVCIITTDEGPMVDDVVWLLKGQYSGCAVPSECDGAKDLIQRLQKLPGFNNEAVIDAMACTSNAQFVCWKRSNQPRKASAEY
jgi:hypothetical protein